jgi:ribosomal protein L16/L10AE
MALCGELAAASPEKEKTKTHGVSVSGVVAQTNDAARTFVVRASGGKETTLVRTAATKLNGKDLKSGDRVAVRYLERDGKKIATSIRVEPPAVAAATPTAPAPSLR